MRVVLPSGAYYFQPPFAPEEEAEFNARFLCPPVATFRTDVPQAAAVMRGFRLNSEQFEHLNSILADLDDREDCWQALCEARIAADPMFFGISPFDVWVEWADKRYRELRSDEG